MAFALINPVNAIWQQRGLNCLLMPEGFDAFAAREAAAPAPAPVRRQPADPQRAAQRRAQPEATRPAWERPRRPQEGQPSAAQGEQRASQPTPRPERNAAQPTAATRAATAAATGASPAEDAGPAAPWLPLPPHVWPTPWQARLQQTRPGPVLWTYWNLGADLCDPQAPGRQERRQFLQRLLHDLGHPAGTHTFWPSCLPPDADALPSMQAQTGGYVPNADVFWSGARQLQARGVVVMGSAAASAVGLPGGLRPPQQIRHRSKLVWVLWDVDNLLDSDQRYASMLALLRDALRRFLR